MLVLVWLVLLVWLMLLLWLLLLVLLVLLLLLLLVWLLLLLLLHRIAGGRGGTQRYSGVSGEQGVISKHGRRVWRRGWRRGRRRGQLLQTEPRVSGDG